MDVKGNKMISYKRVSWYILGYMKKSIIVLVCCFFVLASCNNDLKTGQDLSNSDIKYLKSIGLLDNDENIIQFDSQSGFGDIESGGSFYSNKRIASYWIDKHDAKKSYKKYLYYSEIDTIIPVDLSKAWTLSSYLEVNGQNGYKFKVYVDSDSLQTWDFFNRAINEWIKNRK